MGRSLSIVVPVYNEAGNVEELYRQIASVVAEQGYDAEIVLVDDASTDGSAEVLDRLARAHGEAKVIHLARNYGQTAALMAGLDHSTAAVVVAIDGDLQNDPADIPRLLAKLEHGFDVVSGWRRARREGLARTLPSRLANWLIARTTGVRLHDFGCTLKAYRRDVLGDVRLYGEMHRFIPVYAAWAGGRIAELEVSHRPRRAGASKYGLGRTGRVLLDLVVVLFLHRALDRPVQFFGRIGLWSFGLGILAGAYALYLKVVEDVSFILTPLPLLISLLWLTGLLCVLLGVVAEMLTRIYFESRNSPFYRIRSTLNLE
ncbi:MAG TPA: glycosyltransferase family 2 protein [Alphaproteobacteria bacterium]